MASRKFGTVHSADVITALAEYRSKAGLFFLSSSSSSSSVGPGG